MRATVIELFVVRDRAALSESLARGHRLVVESEAGSVSPDRATMALIKLYVGMSEARLLDRPLEAVRLLRQAYATANESGYTALGLRRTPRSASRRSRPDASTTRRHLARDVLAEANAKGWGDLPGVAMASGYLGWLALWKGEPAERSLCWTGARRPCSRTTGRCSVSSRRCTRRRV